MEGQAVQSTCARVLRAAVCLAALLVMSRPADAEIYSWRDASGNLVVSNVPQGKNAGIPLYNVAEATGAIRSTRYVAPAKARPFDDIIEAQASNMRVRTDLVRAVIQVESAFNPRAVSNKGAMGLMQLMPATARQFGVRNAFDPGENVRGGVAYLRQLLDRYNGDERLALAAYNAGPGAVDRYGQTVPPYAETRDYVSRINGLAGTSAAAVAPVSASKRVRIYRVVEMVEGREVVKYTDQAPAR